MLHQILAWSALIGLGVPGLALFVYAGFIEYLPLSSFTGILLFCAAGFLAAYISDGG